MMCFKEPDKDVIKQVFIFFLLFFIVLFIV